MRNATITKGTALLLVLMLLFNGLMPLQAPKQVYANSESSGEGGDGGSGSGTTDSTGRLNVAWQGLRVYLLNPDGSLRTDIVDILTTLDVPSDAIINQKLKDGTSGTWGQHAELYATHFPGMPTPYEFVPTSGVGTGNYLPRGTEIREWFDREDSSTGKTNLQVWLDNNDVFGLRGEKEPFDVMYEEDLIFVYEPIVWLEMSSGTTWTGTWFYGTPANHNVLANALGHSKDSNAAAIVRKAFPESVYIDKDLETTSGAKYTSFAGDLRLSKTWWELSDFSPKDGHSLGWVRPLAGGTSTWDEEDYPDKPGEPPEEDPGEDVTIIKNYVTGYGETEQHVETWWRDDTLKQITVENEPYIFIL